MKRVLLLLLTITLISCQRISADPINVVNEIESSGEFEDWIQYQGYGYTILLPRYYYGELVTERANVLFGNAYNEMEEGEKSPLIDPDSDVWIEMLYAVDTVTDLRVNDTQLFVNFGFLGDRDIIGSSPSDQIAYLLDNLPPKYVVVDVDYPVDSSYLISCAMAEINTSLRASTSIYCTIVEDGFAIQVQFDTSTMFMDEALPTFKKIISTIEIKKPILPWFNPVQNAVLTITGIGLIVGFVVAIIKIRKRVTRKPMSILSETSSTSDNN